MTKQFLCFGRMASSVAGHKRAFGSDTVPGCYEDLDQADLLVLVGSNAAWCHPVLYEHMMAAKAKNPGCHVVVIDPRRTDTCDGADLHLPLRSGSDAVLFNAAAICGLSEGAVQLLFDWFAKTEKVVTLYSQGINQSTSGTDKVNAIINCHLSTGRIDVRACAEFGTCSRHWRHHPSPSRCLANSICSAMRPSCFRVTG